MKPLPLALAVAKDLSYLISSGFLPARPGLCFCSQGCAKLTSIIFSASGQVLPSMAQLAPHLAAPPSIATQPQGRTQPRVGELLAALVSRQVHWLLHYMLGLSWPTGQPQHIAVHAHIEDTSYRSVFTGRARVSGGKHLDCE